MTPRRPGEALAQFVAKAGLVYDVDRLGIAAKDLVVESMLDLHWRSRLHEPKPDPMSGEGERENSPQGVARSTSVGALVGVLGGSDSEWYVAFWRANEARLRRALVAHYGAHDGRTAAADAMSWAWEHWADVAGMTNPVGYLYRVGQTAARKQQRQAVAVPGATTNDAHDPAGGDLDLIDALRCLSDQQRVAVLLVHAHGYSQREAAELLELGVSTVRVHLDRALRHLREKLEVSDGP